MNNLIIVLVKVKIWYSKHVMVLGHLISSKGLAVTLVSLVRVLLCRMELVGVVKISHSWINHSLNSSFITRNNNYKI
jgi:hypothetical protein